MSEPLLQVSGVTKRFGGFVALDNVDLIVRPGERLGLIGPNGSGKSTLVNCVSGTLRNESGSIRFEGRDIGGKLPTAASASASRAAFRFPGRLSACRCSTICAYRWNTRPGST